MLRLETNRKRFSHFSHDSFRLSFYSPTQHEMRRGETKKTFLHLFLSCCTALLCGWVFEMKCRDKSRWTSKFNSYLLMVIYKCLQHIFHHFISFSSLCRVESFSASFSFPAAVTSSNFFLLFNLSRRPTWLVVDVVSLLFFHSFRGVQIKSFRFSELWQLVCGRRGELWLVEEKNYVTWKHKEKGRRRR